MRRAIVLGAAALAIACVPAPQVEPAQDAPAEPMQPVAAPTPAPAPAPPPPLPPPPEPSGPATFLFSGELTQGGWVRGQTPGGTVSASLDSRPLALDEGGRFFAAFDRDAGPVATLSATLESGDTVERLLTVAPREWNIERVNVARRAGGPSEAFMRIRRPELARIVAAREIESETEGWQQDFIWPATGRVSGRFGSQRIYRGEPGSYHSGIDITGATGTPFVAPADGVVVLATEEPFSLEGNLLIVDHGMGLNSAFLHLSEIAVSEGQRVQQGQLLGRVGATGRATGPHLHWGITWRGSRLDPLLFTGPMN